MKWRILDSLNTVPYFTVESVKQLWGDTEVAEATVRTALYRWMKAGLIIQLKRGVYMPRRFMELRRGDADFSAAVSAILLPQSYVSLEFILQRHAILTDVTYPVSAVTTRNTRVVANDLGTYTYRHVKADLYRGFASQGRSQPPSADSYHTENAGFHVRTQFRPGTLFAGNNDGR